MLLRIIAGLDHADTDAVFFGGVDMAGRALRDLHQQTGVTTIFVTHDQEETLASNGQPLVVEPPHLHRDVPSFRKALP